MACSTATHALVKCTGSRQTYRLSPDVPQLHNPPPASPALPLLPSTKPGIYHLSKQPHHHYPSRTRPPGNYHHGPQRPTQSTPLLHVTPLPKNQESASNIITLFPSSRHPPLKPINPPSFRPQSTWHPSHPTHPKKTNRQAPARPASQLPGGPHLRRRKGGAHAEFTTTNPNPHITM